MQRKEEEGSKKRKGRISSIRKRERGRVKRNTRFAGMLFAKGNEAGRGLMEGTWRMGVGEIEKLGPEVMSPGREGVRGLVLRVSASMH